MAFGLAPKNINSLLYAGSGLYFAPALPLNHAPTTHDRYPIITFAINKDVPHVAGNAEGDLWYLARYQGQLHNPDGLAIWIRLSGGSSGPILSITVPNPINEIIPNPVDGEITFTSVDNSVTIAGSPDNHTIDFSVTAGTNPIERIEVDNADAPGVNPVEPIAGLLQLFGEIVQPNAGIPIRTETDTLGQIRIQTQVTTTSTNGAKTIDNAGLSSFDSNFFLVDAATGFVSSTAIANTLGPANIGIKLAAGVFTIVGSNGQFLSATNPGYVTLHSNTITGGFITYKLTYASLAASPNFHDNSSGTTTIAGNTFGLDNNVNCANDVPFFIYAVSKSDDTALEFMISRYPNTRTSPVAAKIAQTGLTTQGSFFSFNSVTAANYAQTNCTCLGAFRMTKVATNANDWTVTALAASEGIGTFFDFGLFTWPTGYYGAAASSYFKSNGGTAPIYSDGTVAYRVSRDNTVSVAYVLGTNTTPAAGAVEAQAAYPFIALGGGVLSPGNIATVASLTTSAVANQKYFVSNYQSTAANASLDLATIAANSVVLNGQAPILFS